MSLLRCVSIVTLFLFAFFFIRRGRHIFAQREQDPDMHGHVKFVSLPLKVATFPRVRAAKEALARIDEARRLRKGVVDLRD